MAEKKNTRRDFLNRFIGGWVLVMFSSVVYVVFEYLLPPTIRDRIVNFVAAGKTQELPPNSAKMVKFNKKPVILLHTEDGQYKAFSAVCTHLGCIVQYKAEEKKFRCNCHDSVYDENGKNISGPAPKPLPPYKVKIQGDDITVSIV